MKKLIIVLVIVISLIAVIRVAACPWPPPQPSPTPRPTPVIPTPIPPTAAPTKAPPPTMDPTLGPAPTMPPQPTLKPNVTVGPTLAPRKTQPPVVCDTDTGQAVYELVMFNTDALHYGYWSGNTKTGICKIESTEGYFPSSLISQFCGCQMPGFVWRTDTYTVWNIMVDCNGNQHLEANGEVGEPFGGWSFGDYCPATGCK